MNFTSTKLMIATLVASMLLAGCGAVPIAPMTSDYVDGPRLVKQQTLPTLPKGVTAASLSLTPAQAEAHVGQSLPLQVSIKGSDGKTYSDPRLVVWQLSNPQLGVVDQNGVLVPSTPGSVKVTAMIAGLTADATIQIDEARFAWQQVLSPAHADLHAVKMITPMDAWAGGDHGTLLRFINGSWNVEPTFRQPDADIRGLGFANSNLGWAVGARNGGNSPFISRWMNGYWQTQPLPVADGSLNAVSVVSDHDAWAVGQEGNGDALMLHWDGQNWKQFESPCKGKINDVQMLSQKSGWAVGKFDGVATTPMILKFQNGEWVKKGLWDNRGSVSLTGSQELTAIKMVSETQGYAVGISDPLLLKPRGLFLTYDPKRDGFVPGQYDSKVPDLDQVPLHDIEMISGTEGWVLGETRQPDFTLQRNPKSLFGNLLANDGGVLKMDTNYFSGNLSGSFNAIDLLPTGEGFVVGQAGFILQRTYDWRNLNNSGSGYGNSYGNNGQNTPVTYGPGGERVPGTGTPQSPADNSTNNGSTIN